MNTSIVILLGALAVGQEAPSFVVGAERYVVRRGDELPPGGFIVQRGKPLPVVRPKAVPLTREQAISKAKAAGKPLVVVQGCQAPEDAMWDCHAAEGGPCRTEVWGYHDGWLWLIEEVPEACDVGRVRGILGRWRAPVSDEERRGILPKNRLRWQPYAQPDYQGRMRRQTGSLFGRDRLFGGDRGVSRAAPRFVRGGNC